MPSSSFHRKVNVPIVCVWNFVSDMNHWAPMIPGYMDHHIMNERESTWRFKADFGLMKKKVELKVDILKWVEPTTVNFRLTGINEKASGEGYFKANIIGDHCTDIIGYLEIEVEGGISKMINPLLKTNIQEWTKAFTIGIAEKIEEDFHSNLL